MKAHVSDARIHCPSQPPGPTTDSAPTLADGNICTGQPRRTSPGPASAATPTQTRHVFRVRASSPTLPSPPQTRSQYFHGGTTQIHASDTARIPQLPRAIQLLEWQHIVRENFGSASGRLAKACTFFCVAEQHDTTSEDLQDSSDFESINCKLAAGRSTVLNVELRHIMKNHKAQEHEASFMLTCRKI
eukprot:9498223-Pyramimonas_sp.AAC.1